MKNLIEIAVTQVLQSIPKIDFHKSFKIPINRLKYCISSEEMYFEQK